MKIKFSGRTQPLFPKYTLLDALQVIQGLGFDGVEICLEVDELLPDLLSAEKAAQVRDKVLDLGLEPHTVGYHVDYIFRDDLFHQTQAAIKLAPEFGTDILIFSGTAVRGGGLEEWQRMLKRTRVLVELAEDHGVILAQEFEPGFIIGSTLDLLRLFDAIPSTNLAANLDLGHVFLCDPDPLESIRLLGPKIVHGHIENMRTGVHDHQVPQEGDMGLGAYLKALDAAGFTGALALDLYKYDYESVSPAALSYLRSFLAESGSKA